MKAMSRVTAPAIVAVSLVLCVISTVAYLLIAPLFFQSIPWLGAVSLSVWLWERIPGWVYNILVRGLFQIALFGFLVAMTVSLVAGPRALRARLRRRGMTLSLCGLLLAAVYCAGPTIWYARSRRTMEELQASGKILMANLRESLEAGTIPEPQRERMWQLYAGAMYRDEGIEVEIPDATGRLVAWQPSDSDIAVRRVHLEMLERLRPPTGQVKGSVAWVALCLGVGLLWPLRRRTTAGDASTAQSAPPHNPGTGTAGGE